MAPSGRLGVLVVSLLCLTAPAAPAEEARVVARGDKVNEPRQPQVAVDDAGGIHVAWGSGDRVFYRGAASADAGFGAEHALELAPVMSLGMRRGPRIAASGGAVCITAIGGPTGKGRDGDVWSVRTRDGGRTWSDPVRVNRVEGSAREGLHGMAAGPDGRLCCVWLDLRNGRTEIMAAISPDGGDTWAPDVLVYRAPEKNVCECCHPAVVWDGPDDVWVQWRNSIGGNRDMYHARSRDGGKTFGDAAKLGEGSWALAACPMDGGAIAVVDGKLSSVWRREKTVYLVEGAGSAERSLGAGEQPWLAATEAGPCVAWVESRGGRLRLLEPGAKKARTLATHASDPVLAVGPAGRSPLVAVWEEREGDEARVMCEVVGRR